MQSLIKIPFSPLCFPTSPKEIPFNCKKVKEIRYGKDTVFYCKPELKKHPVHWLNKDEVVQRGDVDSVVKAAVADSMPRVVVKAAIVENGKVLLVLGKRGYSKGFWGLPGGFLLFGESPQESLEREVLEEASLKVETGECIKVFGRFGSKKSRNYYVLLVFKARIVSGNVTANQDDVSRATWFTQSQALKLKRLRAEAAYAARELLK